MAHFPLDLLLKRHIQIYLSIIKEAHHQVMEDDGTGSGPVDDNEDSVDKLDEEATNDSDPKGVMENSDEVGCLLLEGVMENSD